MNCHDSHMQSVRHELDCSLDQVASIGFSSIYFSGFATTRPFGSPRRVQMLYLSYPSSLILL